MLLVLSLVSLLSDFAAGAWGSHMKPYYDHDLGGKALPQCHVEQVVASSPSLDIVGVYRSTWRDPQFFESMMLVGSLPVWSGLTLGRRHLRAARTALPVTRMFLHGRGAGAEHKVCGLTSAFAWLRLGILSTLVPAIRAGSFRRRRLRVDAGGELTMMSTSSTSSSNGSPRS